MKPVSPAEPKNQESNSNDENKFIPSTEVSNVTVSFKEEDHAWFVTSDTPTDLSIQVEEITFHMHKYALLTKSGFQFTSLCLGNNIKLDNFPGGAAAFELVVKFCYGLPIGLNPNNVAPLRCASEFLEMTLEFDDGNLISKTEAFLKYIEIDSWRDSVKVLKTCENLSPWAENLQIVRRCCDSICWKALQEKSEQVDNEAWWFEDIATLRIDHFGIIIAALKSKGAAPKVIGSCIKQYADKRLPSMEGEVAKKKCNWYGKTELQFSITSVMNQEGEIEQNREQKIIIENLISVLPPQKEAVSCKFLLRMLKMAIIFSATPFQSSELEKKVGLVLQNANAQDLLIPRYGSRDYGKLTNSPEERTMHNTDTVQRIVEYYVMQKQQQLQQRKIDGDVSKLLDNYLAVIASDPNLAISKFQVLAEALPGNARLCHDGLYRAIDTYIKAHPLQSEQEHRKLCRIMDCQKLSLEACMHVAQNDQLPLKIVTQVLFLEQVKMRAAMQSKEQTTESNNRENQESWSSAIKEIKTLRTELEKVKEDVSELQRDYSQLQTEYINNINKQQSNSNWFKWKRIRKISLFGEKSKGEIGEQETSNQDEHPTNTRRRQSMP